MKTKNREPLFTDINLKPLSQNGVPADEKKKPGEWDAFIDGIVFEDEE